MYVPETLYSPSSLISSGSIVASPVASSFLAPFASKAASIDAMILEPLSLLRSVPNSSKINSGKSDLIQRIVAA